MIAHRIVRWPIEARGAARAWRERAAAIVAVRDDSGATGLGEAAPLPGMSIDTLDDVVRALEAGPRDATSVAAPSARFALETAQLCCRAQRARTSIASLLARHPLATIDSAVVVDDEREARTAVVAGARCLKIKRVDRARAIATAVPGTRLRVDVNRTWQRAEVPARLAALADLPIDFVEEPCHGAHELLDAALPLRIALDESLVTIDDRTLSRALASPQLAALVLKPTLLGGFARCLELAARAHRHGVAPIASHALEGPIGTAACRELARAIAADVPAGVAPHPAEVAWRW